MNLKIIILVFLLVFIIYKLQDYNNINNIENLETTSSIINCNSTNKNIVFKDVYTKKIKFNNLLRNEYLLNLSYPIGSFYVQFPDISNNYLSKAFPDAQKPANLFGGVWEEQWSTDAIFFRTEGGFSNENRATNGIQDYAIRKIWGWTSWTQANNYDPGEGNTGVFGNTKPISITGRADEGASDRTGVRNHFDSSAQSLSSDIEVRVKNRIIKVWKRIA